MPIILIFVLCLVFFSSCQQNMPTSLAVGKLASNASDKGFLPDSLQQTLPTSPKHQDKDMPNPNLDTATFGGGCFWCIETVFQELKGVQTVTSGYAGGGISKPTYKEVCSGLTGHAEVVQITYDPQQITYEDLLKVFWTVHDPTQLNRQGNDVGTQYRSAIFYHNDAQREAAEKSAREVASQLWDAPIVTQITAIHNYYPAEDYHQNYYNLNPNQGYCSLVIAPKVQKFREKFADKLKK